MNIFRWLRSAAKEAILGGVKDAFDELRGQTPELAAIAGPESIASPEEAPPPKKKGGKE